MQITHLLVGFAISTGAAVASIDYIERAYAAGAESASAIQSLLVAEQVDAATKAYEAVNISKPKGIQDLVDGGYLDGKKVSANPAAFKNVGSLEEISKFAGVDGRLDALVDEGRQMIGGEPTLDGASYAEEEGLLYLVKTTSEEECQVDLVKYQEAQVEASCTPAGEATTLRVLIGPAV